MERVIPKDLVGLPITDERARELTETIATCMDNQDDIAALCELLLGIAPMGNFSSLLETSRRRIRHKDLMFDPAEVEGLLTDIWQRFTSASSVIETLYTFTPEFMRALEEYAHGLLQRSDAPEGGEA